MFELTIKYTDTKIQSYIFMNSINEMLRAGHPTLTPFTYF
jgi:hypothetical protein